MFCVLNIILWTLMECLHLFKAAKFGSLKMHVLCKVGKNIIFQNKTFLVMFYTQNKTFWYQFCNFKHFLKAENSEDSLASSWHSKPMVSSVTLLELSDCWHYPSICFANTQEYSIPVWISSIKQCKHPLLYLGLFFFSNTHFCFCCCFFFLFFVFC